MSGKEIVNKIIGAVLAIGAILFAVLDTPPRRAANENVWLRTGIEEQKTKQREADARIAEAQAPRSSAYLSSVGVASVRPVATPAPSGGCISPHPGQTKFSEPIVLSQGGCVKLPEALPRGAYFWATFNTPPSQVSGVEKFRAARYTGTVTADGSPDVEPIEDCTGNCTEFFQRHAGKAVYVKQIVGQSLDIKL